MKGKEYISIVNLVAAIKRKPKSRQQEYKRGKKTQNTKPKASDKNSREIQIERVNNSKTKRLNSQWVLFESALLSNDEQKNSQKITSSNENEQSEDAYIVFN